MSVAGKLAGCAPRGSGGGGVKSELEFDSFFRQFNYFGMHTFNYIIGGINDEEIGESPS